MTLSSHLAKDLRLLLRDRKGVFIALALPVAILAAYSTLDVQQIQAAGRSADAFILVLSAAFPSLLIASTAIVAERRAGTLQRLERSPASVFSIIFAKSLAALTVLTLQVVVISLVALWALDGRTVEGALPLAIVLLAAALSAHALGTLLSASVTTETQASQLSALILLLMITLCGFLQPLEELGTLGAAASYSPTALGYAGAASVFVGETAIVEVAGLLLATVIFLGLAGLLALRRLR